MNEITEIIRKLEDRKLNPGWRVEHRKGGHYIAYPPDKAYRQVTIAATPSDKKHGIRNLRAQLRRAGAQGI